MTSLLSIIVVLYMCNRIIPGSLLPCAMIWVVSALVILPLMALI